MGFVFIEANVKKWGLAPMTGSLAPPPPYGSEQGSILLEGGREGVREGQGYLATHGRSQSAQIRLGRAPPSPGPQRSPTDISLAQLNFLDSQEDDTGEGTSNVTVSQDAQPHPGMPFEPADAPPPDYESPSSEEPEASSTPKASRFPVRSSSNGGPPIPSYEAATAQFEAGDSDSDDNEEREPDERV